jgi:hypothetical protein
MITMATRTLLNVTLYMHYLTEVPSVYCAVRSESLTVIQFSFCLPGVSDSCVLSKLTVKLVIDFLTKLRFIDCLTQPILSSISPEGRHCVSFCTMMFIAPYFNRKTDCIKFCCTVTIVTATRYRNTFFRFNKI